jgi:Xaa-Pro aminopeptidase
MKADLDRLMHERGIDGLIVAGSSVSSAAMYYLANGARVSESGLLIKMRDRAPVLVLQPMERDDAAGSGLEIIDRYRYRPHRLLQDANGDLLRFTVALYQAVFSDLGVRGRIAAYGRQDQGATIALVDAFNRSQSAVTLVGEFSDTIFDVAWMTKDAAEVARIKEVGGRTMSVLGELVEFLRSHRASDGVLVKKDGTPLIAGDVKRELRRWLTAADLEAPDGVTFAVGRDAALWSRGNDQHPLRLGRTILHDIFPREANGGYFFDFTRTWCMDHAPAHVEKAHQDVKDTFERLMAEMALGGSCRAYHRRACELLGARGYATLASDPTTQRGFIHRLGHGVGLSSHERPSFADYDGNRDTVEAGTVVTLEPGVYDPDGDGWGVRLEETVWMNPQSRRFESLATFPMDLVIPVRS